MSQLDPVQIAALPKARYKRAYRRILGEEINSLSISPRGAAQMLGISNSSVYILLNKRKLPAYKLGSKTLIRIADIKKFLSNLPRYEPKK